MKLKKEEIKKAAASALKEDGAFSDITSEALGISGGSVKAVIRAKENGVVCGLEIVREIFSLLYGKTEAAVKKADGEVVCPGDEVINIIAPPAAVLAGERSALNFLSHLSGIATLTSKYVQAARAVNPACSVYDTRKTIPGLRTLEKYAVLCGGGKNHRMSLADQILIKENHLSAGCFGASEAVKKAKMTRPGCVVEIEVENMDQFYAAIGAGADIIMLDDFPLSLIRRACEEAKNISPGALIEVSGGVNLDTIGEIAAAGPGRISAGRITNSAPALDFSMLTQDNE